MRISRVTSGTSLFSEASVADHNHRQRSCVIPDRNIFVEFTVRRTYQVMSRTLLIVFSCFTCLTTVAQYERDTIYCGEQKEDDWIQELAEVTAYYSLVDTLLTRKHKRRLDRLKVMYDTSGRKKKLVSIIGYYKGSGDAFVSIDFSNSTGVINSFGIGAFKERKKLSMSFDSSGRVVSLGKTKRVLFTVNCRRYKNPSYRVKRYNWNTGARYGEWTYWHYEDGGESFTKVVKRYRRNRYWSILSVNEIGEQLDKRSFYFKPKCDAIRRKF